MGISEGLILGFISLFIFHASNSFISSPLLITFGNFFSIFFNSETSCVANSFQDPMNVRATIPDFFAFIEIDSSVSDFLILTDDTESNKISKY